MSGATCLVRQWHEDHIECLFPIFLEYFVTYWVWSKKRRPPSRVSQYLLLPVLENSVDVVLLSALSQNDVPCWKQVFYIYIPQSVSLAIRCNKRDVVGARRNLTWCMSTGGFHWMLLQWIWLHPYPESSPANFRYTQFKAEVCLTKYTEKQEVTGATLQLTGSNCLKHAEYGSNIG